MFDNIMYIKPFGWCMCEKISELDIITLSFYLKGGWLEGSDAVPTVERQA